MNKWIGSGNLGKAPELKNVGENRVATFSIAVKDKFNKEHTNWINCTAWNKTADFIEKYFGKGSGIIVSGRLQVREWEKDGHKRYSTDVVVEEVDFMGKKEKTESATKIVNDFVTVEDDSDDDSLPF